MNNPSALETLFHPKSIAVVGVSHDESSVGSTIYKNIVGNGYKGTVLPVNPFLKTFQGVVSYPSVLSVTEAIDLAILVVPAAIVPSVLEEIGKKDIPVAIIISSGFGEVDAKGTVLEKHVREIAEKYHISILGPNCLGIISPHTKLNASFARTTPLPGSIAFLSQSGALGTALLDIITPKGIGLSHFISLGNKMDINELDLLEFLAEDPSTSVIGMYVEQLKDAERCIAIGKKIALLDSPKPIIVLKGGRTKEGNEAVRSHTGAMAGIPEAYSALFTQSMMIETKSTQEFINTLVSFSENPLPHGNSCAVLTNAGGPAILATDTLISSGVTVPPLTGSHNPIDLLGDAKASDFQKTLSALEKDAGVDSILGIVTPQTVTEIPDTANAFCMHKSTSKKPMAVCWMGEGVMKEGKQLLDMGKIPNSKYPEQTAAMLANLHTYVRFQKHLTESRSPEHGTIQPKGSLAPFSAVDNPLDILTKYHIPVAPFVLSEPTSLATADLKMLSEFVAVKILSNDIIHKSDVGAVSLDVPKEKAVQKAKEMVATVRKNEPKAHISSILFMNMIELQKGLECIVGVKKEQGLGTVIIFGIGGIFVELLNDVSMRFAPLTPEDAKDMIEELRAKALFSGFRRSTPLDVEAGVATLLSISQLIVDHPEITELDINPLVVLPKGQGVIALDCRLTLSE
jgi:acetyltransferase